MLPWFFPEAVVALLFTWIMNPMYGILNSILRGLGLISTNLSWLGSNSFGVPVSCVCVHLERLSTGYDNDTCRTAKYF